MTLAVSQRHCAPVHDLTGVEPDAAESDIAG